MKKILKYVNHAIAALGVVALCMIFVAAIGYEGIGEGLKKEFITYNGLKVVFGYKEAVTDSITVELIKFSFMNLLTYILVLAAIIFAVFGILKSNKLFLLVTIVCALAAAIFFLCTKSFVVLPEDGKLSEEVKLCAGPIVGAICMFLSAIAGTAKLVLEK